MTNVMTESDYLEHFGVRGMKWGVRKQRYDTIRNRKLADFSVTTKHGEKLRVTEERSGRLASFVNSFSDKKMKNSLGYHNMSISHNGKKVGDTSVADVGNGELNLVWLGINPSQRGKGYAGAVFKSAIIYGKTNGFKKLTLEVPGNSPDARHIYEKNGFKVTHEATKAESKDDVWGGLTNMEYDIDHIKHSDLNSDPSDDLEEAIEQTFPELPTDVANEVWKDDIMHSNIMTESEYLEHFGVLGMKWGVRRNRKNSSGKSSRKSKKESRPIDAESDFLTKNKNRNLSTMSNEDLQRINTRMNLENNYKTQSKNYQTNNRSVASNLAYNLPAALLTATVSAVVGIYAQRGAKGIDNLLRKGVNRAFTLRS